MNIPPFVKIGPVTYAIKFLPRLLADDGSKADGLIKYSPAEIWIEDEMSQQAATQTFWHEIIHGILTTTGHAEGNKDEGMIDALAYGIMQVLQDNPLLRE